MKLQDYIRHIRPGLEISEGNLSSGLKHLLAEGVFYQGMLTLTSGAFLVGYALSLGASNTEIGVLAALPFFGNLFQLPSVYVIEHARWRKGLSLASTFASRTFLFLIITLPFAFRNGPVTWFIVFMAVGSVVSSVSYASFNSWMRDLVPGESMGSYYARRMKLSMLIGVALSISAGYFIDRVDRAVVDETTAYSMVFFLALLLGMGEMYFQARIPEPSMPPTEDTCFARRLMAPLREPSFRSLIKFTSAWGFALNMVAPFFAVYMLTRLDIGLGKVVLITVASQLTTVMFLPVWGRLFDRYSNKSVLGSGVVLYILAFVAWPFTTLPEKHLLTAPMLFVIHLLLGLANGCVALGTNNIALKLSPKGTGTAHLAVNNALASFFSGLAPLAGGLLGDWFQRYELDLEFITRELAPERLVLLNARGLDFLFVFAIALGFYALHCLSLVVEEGDVEESVIYRELIAESRQTIRNVSTIAGVQYVTYIPTEFLVKPVFRGFRGMRKALFRRYGPME